jgi:hypothetical protein
VTKKPSYLGLLNAIALGEGRAYKYLSAWAERTPDPDVAGVLRTVAIREGEHSLAFEKRLCELGYGVLDRPDPDFEKRMDLVCSSRSDLEKFEGLGYRRDGSRQREDGEFLKHLLDDDSIDVQTSELLGRYIGEERDSGRRLRACYEALRARADAEGAAPRAGDGRDLDSRFAEISRLIAELRRDIDALRD